MEVKVWVLTAVVSALFGILLIIVQASLKRLIGRVDQLIDQLHELNKSVGVQAKSIDNLVEKNNEQDRRLNNHAERIRLIESPRKR